MFTATYGVVCMPVYSAQAPLLSLRHRRRFPLAPVELRIRIADGRKGIVGEDLGIGWADVETRLEHFEARAEAFVLRDQRTEHVAHGVGEVRVIERIREAPSAIRRRVHEATGDADDCATRGNGLHDDRAGA